MCCWQPDAVRTGWLWRKTSIVELDVSIGMALALRDMHAWQPGHALGTRQVWLEFHVDEWGHACVQNCWHL
jgi:hypothetical protein